MFKTADVVVVGGGVNGLSTALELRELGVGRVVLLERHMVASGQSGRAAGICRALVPHTRTARWQLESQRSFLGFSERFGLPIPVAQPGYLLVGRAAERELIEQGVGTAPAIGAPAEIIDAPTARDLQTGLRGGEDVVYAYEPGAVHVDPMVTAQALALAARRTGVDIREECAVEEILCDADKVAGVRTADGTIGAGAVMVATSVWGAGQLAAVGLAF